MTDMTYNIKLNSKWRLIALTTKYNSKNGFIHTDINIIKDFKDINKNYMALVYYGGYNGILYTKKTDDFNSAMKFLNSKKIYSGYSHSCIIAKDTYNSAINKEVYGREGYRIVHRDTGGYSHNSYLMALVHPKNCYI